MIIPEKHDELLRSQKAKANRTDAGAERGEGRRELLPAEGRPESMETRPNMAALEGDARAELSGEHIAELRQRIRDGAYNTVEIADQVAQRLLSSGDLDLSDE